jgi:hypothetical protein
MTEQFVVSVKDLVKGKVNPDELTAQYIIVEEGGWGRSLERFAEAINYMAKFKWRAIGVAYSRGYMFCLMTR